MEKGTKVAIGQVIGRVSSPEFEAQLRAAQSDLQAAQDASAGRVCRGHADRHRPPYPVPHTLGTETWQNSRQRAALFDLFEGRRFTVSFTGRAHSDRAPLF